MSDNQETQRFAFDQSAQASYPWVRQPCLVEVGGEHFGRLFCLTEPAYIMGRGSQADLQFDYDGVSRTHCRLLRAPEGYQIVDMGSRNGTFVNGFQITKQLLKEGDKVALGPRAVFVYHVYDMSETLALGLLYEASAKDVLTGAQNRDSFLEWLSTQLATARDRKFDVAVLYVSLDHGDHLKKQLDSKVTDRLVLELYQMLQKVKPESSPLARVSTFDFVLAASYVNLSELDQLRSALREGLNSVKGPPDQPPLTLSLGIATSRESSVPQAVRLFESALRKVVLARAHGQDTLVL